MTFFLFPLEIPHMKSPSRSSRPALKSRIAQQSVAARKSPAPRSPHGARNSRPHASSTARPWTKSRSGKPFRGGNLTLAQARALDKAWEAARVGDDIPYSLIPLVALLDLLSIPAFYSLMMAQRGARALMAGILRSVQKRETAPAPSLRGTPDANDIDTAWRIVPRTLQDALRIGSRLLDLEPAVDNSFVWKENPRSGRREIVARHAGIKGWLQLHCPTVRYKTAMRYKKLASRLRTICGVPGNVPLEWLLPDAPVYPAGGLDAKTLAAIEKGRKELASILAETSSLRGLDRVAAQRMDIVRIPRGNKEISLVSHKKRTGKSRVPGSRGCKGDSSPEKSPAESKTPHSGPSPTASRQKSGPNAVPPGTVADKRIRAALEQAFFRPEGRKILSLCHRLLGRRDSPTSPRHLPGPQPPG